MIRPDKVNGKTLSVVVQEDNVKAGEFRELKALATGMEYGDGEVFTLDPVGTTVGATVVVLCPVQMDYVWDMNEAEYTFKNGEVSRAYALDSTDIVTLGADITVPAEAGMVDMNDDETIMGIACKAYRKL